MDMSVSARRVKRSGSDVEHTFQPSKTISLHFDCDILDGMLGEGLDAVGNAFTRVKHVWRVEVLDTRADGNEQELIARAPVELLELGRWQH